MYVLLSSILETLNAARDIAMLLADMKPMDRKELAMIEKHLINMIRCALDSYGQALEQSLKEDPALTAQQHEEHHSAF